MVRLQKSSINSDYKILSLCKEKYQSYVEMAQCSLGLNAYFQLCRIIKSSKYEKKKSINIIKIFVDKIKKYQEIYRFLYIFKISYSCIYAFSI